MMKVTMKEIARQAGVTPVNRRQINSGGYFQQGYKELKK